MSKPAMRTGQKRSTTTTIVAIIIGLLVLVFILSLLPLKSIPEVLFFCGGILVIILCAMTAIMGNKNAIIDLIWSISTWF